MKRISCQLLSATTAGGMRARAAARARTNPAMNLPERETIQRLCNMMIPSSLKVGFRDTKRPPGHDHQNRFEKRGAERSSSERQRLWQPRSHKADMEKTTISDKPENKETTDSTARNANVICAIQPISR